MSLKLDTNNHYRHVEPRLSMRYKLNPTSSVKASYSEKLSIYSFMLLQDL